MNDIDQGTKRWWQELSSEEIDELHRFYAEVNALNDGFPVQRRNDQLAVQEDDRNAASVGDTEAF